MAAFNVVRFKVKPGYEQQFVDAHRSMRPDLKGFLGGSLIRTGDRTFCFVGEWRTFKSIEVARPQMIAMLDQVRQMLEDLGQGLGVTDPVSGDAVLRLPATRARKKAAKKSRSGAGTARKRATKRAGGSEKARRQAMIADPRSRRLRHPDHRLEQALDDVVVAALPGMHG